MIPSATPASSRRLVEQMAAGETQQNKSDQQRAKDGTQAERPAGQDSFAQQDGGNEPDARAVGDPQQPRLRQRISNNACIIAPESASAAPPAAPPGFAAGGSAR